MYSKKLFGILLAFLVIGVGFLVWGVAPTAAMTHTGVSYEGILQSAPVVTATATVTPTATKVTGRATPTLAPVLPTATSTSAPIKAPIVAPTNTAVPPTATKVLPTATVTPTKVLPTATKVPPTATPIKPAVRSPLLVTAATTKTLSTNFSLVNMGTLTATVSISYYQTNGNNWTVSPANASLSLPADSQVQLRQYWDTNMTSGQGSAVVTSDQPLGSIVQILWYNQTPPTTESYLGFATSDNQFYLPLVFHQLTNANSQLVNSLIAIQNVGSSTITSSVQFIGTSYTNSSISIPAYSTYYYDLSGESNLPVGYGGSAVVTAGSGGQITVVNNNFAGSDQLVSYNGFPSSSLGTSWFVPVFFVRLTDTMNNGLSSPVVVQNLSGSTIPVGAVHLDCVPTDGVSAQIHAVNPASIANNASYSFNPVTNLTDFPNAPWTGACNVTSGSYNTIATIQYRKIGSQNAAGTNAIQGTSTDKTLFFPLVTKKGTNGFSTFEAIQNLSLSNTAHVTLNFTPSSACVGCSSYQTTTTIAPGSNVIVDMRLDTLTVGANTVSMPNAWEGSLKVVSSDQPIHGNAHLWNILATSGDTMRAIAGFTLP